MAEIDIPPYFLCPIALQVMKDPVTISTGITYERDSIEKWIFTEKKDVCPVTKQVLLESELIIPNVILRRMIQSWCVLHSSYGIERLPTPKSPVSSKQIVKLFKEAKCPQTKVKCLQKLKSISSQNQTNKMCLQSVGAHNFLASLIIENAVHLSENMSESKKVCDEALMILYSLHLSESAVKSLANPEFVEALTRVMQFGSYETRAYAVMQLKSIIENADPAHLVNLNSQFFVELTQILKDQISQKASKATLKVLVNVCSWGRNRIRAVEAGIVPVLIDLLLDSSSSNKTTSEIILTVLDYLCQCADGRSDFVNHPASLAIVSKKILRVSPAGSERAVRILHSVLKYSATSVVLQEMLHMGAVAKLCLALQVDCGLRIKERARDILKLHARAWRSSSCIPGNLISSYPS